jgi:hypothetical protein
MRGLPYCDNKFTGFAVYGAAYFQGVDQVGMPALIERAGQPDPRLHRKQKTCHAVLSRALFLDSVMLRASAIRIRGAVRPKSVWPRLDD